MIFYISLKTHIILGSVHYLGTWEEYRIPREGYRIPDTSDGRGREFLTYQMGGIQNPSASREGYRIPTRRGRVAEFQRVAGGVQNSDVSREGHRIPAPHGTGGFSTITFSYDSVKITKRTFTFF